MLPSSEKNSQKTIIHIQNSRRGSEIEIETDRLLIRSYRNEDFEYCEKLYADEKLMKYFDFGKALSSDEVRNLVFERGLKFFSNGCLIGLFSMFDKNTGVFLGQVDLLPTDEPGLVEVGCILHRQYHNQGLPLEACYAMTYDYVQELDRRHFRYEGIQIQRVMATAHPKNYASQRLIKNLGMAFDKKQERFGSPRLWFSCSPYSQPEKDELQLKPL